MIAVSFIIRLVLFLLAVAILAAMAIAVVYVLSWAFRLLVTFLDAHFKEQMAWLRSVLPKRKRKRKRTKAPSE